MDDNTRVAKEKTFWDKLSPEYMYNKNSVGSNAITDRVQVHSRPIHVNSLENIWEMGYLSGRKVKSFGRGEKR